MFNYFSFLYLDEESINELYPQVFDDIVEKNISQTNEESIEGDTNTNLFTIVGAELSGKEKASQQKNIRLYYHHPKKPSD